MMADKYMAEDIKKAQGFIDKTFSEELRELGHSDYLAGDLKSKSYGKFSFKNYVCPR